MVIEGKITDFGCDPSNIQVSVFEYKDDGMLMLSDHEGAFLTVYLDSEREGIQIAQKDHVITRHHNHQTHRSQ